MGNKMYTNNNKSIYFTDIQNIELKLRISNKKKLMIFGTNNSDYEIILQLSNTN